MLLLIVLLIQTFSWTFIDCNQNQKSSGIIETTLKKVQSDDDEMGMNYKEIDINDDYESDADFRSPLNLNEPTSTEEEEKEISTLSSPKLSGQKEEEEEKEDDSIKAQLNKGINLIENSLTSTNGSMSCKEQEQCHKWSNFFQNYCCFKVKDGECCSWWKFVFHEKEK
jgi:hypothetical protein